MFWIILSSFLITALHTVFAQTLPLPMHWLLLWSTLLPLSVGLKKGYSVPFFVGLFHDLTWGGFPLFTILYPFSSFGGILLGKRFPSPLICMISILFSTGLYYGILFLGVFLVKRLVFSFSPWVFLSHLLLALLFTFIIDPLRHN